MPLHKRLLEASPIGEIGSFVKENPILVGSSLAATVGGITAITVASRRKKSTRRRKTTSKRKTTRRRIVHRNKRHVRRAALRKRRRITHRSPRHKGHKKVSFTTKGGKKVSFLVKK